MISFKTASQALKFVKKEGFAFVDFKFVDLVGTLLQATMPASALQVDDLEDGVAFDGSSVRGFREIHESDMLLKPDLQSAFINPFSEDKTLSFFCFSFDPLTNDFFAKCPRYTAVKAESYLKKEGVADVSYWGPEPEFFVFNEINFNLSSYDSYIRIGQEEVEGDGMLVRSSLIPKKAGYGLAPPYDKMLAFRNRVVVILEQLGIASGIHHHEVGAAGQCEIELKYDSLLAMADKVMLYKYVVRNVAAQMGLSACFLPKPIYGDNGSGMHCHQSLWKGGRNIFFDKKGYAQLSETALHYIGGLLTKVNSLLGFSAPTLNSYRRLVPHFEAPIKIAFSKSNRSAAVRIPYYMANERRAKRVEFRCPDTSANPYFCFAAQLVAGVWGVKQTADPVKLKFGPFDKNIYDEGEGIRDIQTDFFQNLASLSSEDIFVESGIFDRSLIESYISVKENEAREQILYPTPADFWFGY